MDIISLRDYQIAAKDLYINSLLFPEEVVAKIPGPLPISSATASLRDNFSITPNSSGKFALIIDPFSSRGFLYQDNTLNGTGTYGNPINIDFGQSSSIVDQFRLVSASLVIRYYGNFNQMSGVFVSATTSLTSGNITDFLTFQNVEDLTNKFVSKCVDGVKLIYTPMDNRAIEFRPNAEYTYNNNPEHPCRNQYLFVVIGDLFPNSTCIRVDYYRNIEYTTLPAYREYILQSKSLPCQYEIPMLPSGGQVAPDNTRNVPTSLQNNNVPYAVKLIQWLNKKGINIDPNIF